MIRMSLRLLPSGHKIFHKCTLKKREAEEFRFMSGLESFLKGSIKSQMIINDIMFVN